MPKITCRPAVSNQRHTSTRAQHTWQSNSSSCWLVSPFTVPCVPTGMNIGVLAATCGSVIVAALALPHDATISNLSAADAVSAVDTKYKLGKGSPGEEGLVPSRIMDRALADDRDGIACAWPALNQFGWRRPTSCPQLYSAVRRQVPCPCPEYRVQSDAGRRASCY